MAEQLRESNFQGLVDVASSYDSLGVYFDGRPSPMFRETLERFIAELHEAPAEQPLIEVPVCYGMGEDTPEVCDRLGIDAEALACEHASVEYRCYAVGFQPGFPYLGYLPDSLMGVPRLPDPRPRVVSGSVGLTGRQTGIYPGGSPGGWPTIGRTPLRIVDLEAGSFLFRSGCRVRFYPISREEFDTLASKNGPGTIE